MFNNSTFNQYSAQENHTEIVEELPLTIVHLCLSLNLFNLILISAVLTHLLLKHIEGHHNFLIHYIFLRFMISIDLLIASSFLFSLLCARFWPFAPNILIYFLALVLNLSILTNVYIHTAVNVNRFCAIVLFKSYKTIFTEQFTIKFLSIITLASVVFFGAILFLDVPLIPKAAEIAGIIVKVCVLAALVINLVLYSILLVFIIKRASVVSEHLGKANFRREIKLLIHALITTVLIALVATVVFLEGKSELNDSINLILISLYAGAGSLLTIISNEEMKNKVIACFKSKVTPVVN